MLDNYIICSMMILINGREIISDVIVREDGTFGTTDVPGRYWNNKMEPIDKERFTELRIPYIEVPSAVFVKNTRDMSDFYFYGGYFGDVDDIECETGYINISNGIKEKSSLIIENIEIKKLIIKTQAKMEVYSWGASHDQYLRLDFHYDFIIGISLDEQDYLEHTFVADAYKQFKTYEQKKYNIEPLKSLFRDIIPSINAFIKTKSTIRNINFNYLDQLLPQKEKIDIPFHSFKFSDALDVIYNAQFIEHEDGNVEIEFGKGMLPYMNKYIVSLLNSLLKIQLKLDNKTRTYKSNLPLCLSYPKDIISLPNYVQCLLFIGAYKYFDTEQARNNYLLLPSSDDTDIIEIDPPYENCLNDTFLTIYDFIADMEASHIEDGQYRAGRDDREWKEKTYMFPFKKELKDSETIIGIINRLLNIKLEPSWDSSENHLSYYYSFECYDDGYIGGMACSRHDIGSDKLRKESFYLLLDYFVKQYISDTAY